jgi:hypothetical protein
MARELTYPEQIAQMRQERAAREHVERLTDIQTEYQQVVQERDEAASRGDLEVFEEADTRAEALEKDWNYYNPPQQPQMSPASARWLRRNTPFRQRYGARADQAIQLAHENAVRAGYKPDTKAYFKAVETSLDTVMPAVAPMLPQLQGMHYDPSEKMMDANEAAKVCGMSPQYYNDCARQAWAAGKHRR